MSLRKVMSETLSKWMKGQGPQSDIVLTSRVRLARNIEGVPFPHMAGEEQLSELIKKLEKIFTDQKKLGKFKLIRLKDLSIIERHLLVEKHLISPQLAKSSTGGLILRNDESAAIMLNEEDHIRSQCIFSGLQLEKALNTNNEIDNYIESKETYAFSPKYGYLTACPTNVGTGMRASIMVHLPALAITEQLNQLFSAVSQLALAVRGIYGEGTEALGNLYQISNQVTLGQSEGEIIENLNGVASQVIEREHNARDLILNKSKTRLIDRVWRAYGILRNAHIISTEEAMKLLSEVRLGIDLGLIKDLESQILNELIVFIRPAYLQWIEREELSASERDIKRAELIRERLKIKNKRGE